MHTTVYLLERSPTQCRRKTLTKICQFDDIQFSEVVIDLKFSSLLCGLTRVCSALKASLPEVYFWLCFACFI